DEAKAKLDRFVEAVLATLPSEPTHWANHPIWAYHYPRFHEARAAFLGGHWQPLSAGSTALVAASAEPALPVSAAGSGPRAIARRKRATDPRRALAGRRRRAANCQHPVT